MRHSIHVGVSECFVDLLLDQRSHCRKRVKHYERGVHFLHFVQFPDYVHAGYYRFVFCVYAFFVIGQSFPLLFFDFLFLFSFAHSFEFFGILTGGILHEDIEIQFVLYFGSFQKFHSHFLVLRKAVHSIQRKEILPTGRHIVQYGVFRRFVYSTSGSDSLHVFYELFFDFLFFSLPHFIDRRKQFGVLNFFLFVFQYLFVTLRTGFSIGSGYVGIEVVFESLAFFRYLRFERSDRHA